MIFISRGGRKFRVDGPAYTYGKRVFHEEFNMSDENQEP